MRSCVQQPARALQFSPKGRFLAGMETLGGLRHELRCLSVSPTHAKLANGGPPSTVRGWESDNTSSLHRARRLVIADQPNARWFPRRMDGDDLSSLPLKRAHVQTSWPRLKTTSIRIGRCPSTFSLKLQSTRRRKKKEKIDIGHLRIAPPTRYHSPLRLPRASRRQTWSVATGGLEEDRRNREKPLPGSRGTTGPWSQTTEKHPKASNTHRAARWRAPICPWWGQRQTETPLTRRKPKKKKNRREARRPAFKMTSGVQLLRRSTDRLPFQLANRKTVVVPPQDAIAVEGQALQWPSTSDDAGAAGRRVCAPAHVDVGHGHSAGQVRGLVKLHQMIVGAESTRAPRKSQTASVPNVTPRPSPTRQRSGGSGEGPRVLHAKRDPRWRRGADHGFRPGPKAILGRDPGDPTTLNLRADDDVGEPFSSPTPPKRIAPRVPLKASEPASQYSAPQRFALVDRRSGRGSPGNGSLP